MRQSEEVMGVVLYKDAIFHHLNKIECHRLNVEMVPLKACSSLGIK